MRIAGLTSMAVAIVVLAATLDARAQAPAAPAAPNTLWSFLGIPQGFNKIKDATANKSGNNPSNERKPPLKRIADPSNLESQNPAIKAAAKVKAEEDLAPQKIKAIKYLATIGCGCYPGVKEALVAALDDCTEAVRYEAAIALCQAAGDHCSKCGKTCCSAAVMSKLEEMAHEQDDSGCFKESSPRVRAAAENALNACRQKLPPGSEPIEAPQKEVPLQPTPAAPESRPNIEIPVPEDNRTPAPTRGAALRPEHGQVIERSEFAATVKPQVDGVRVDTISLSRTEIASEEVAGETVAMNRRPRWCPPSPCPTEEAAPSKAAPGETAPAAPSEQPAPSNALAGNFGATSGPTSAAPNMIGDIFGAGGIFIQNEEGEGPTTLGRAPLPGNTVPRFKMADNTSPLPQDRVYFDYSFYGNVQISDPGIGVNGFAPGFEKTFFDGRMSIELRAPMAATLDHNIFFDNSTRTSVGELGDLGIAMKLLLVQNERFALSGGLAMTVPTGPDERFFTNHQDPDIDILIKSESVHLMPFFGLQWTPNDRWFSITYLQFDVDANGNAVSVDNGEISLTPLGRYREPTFMYLDTALGCWLYRSDCPHNYLTGLAPVVEAHVNQSLERSPILSSNGNQVGGDVNGNPINNITIVDLTVGLHAELCGKTTMTAGYCLPVTGDRQFDGQFLFYVNRRF
jgi:hypothetical protein